MPTFHRGNMWDVFGKTDLFLITTNPIITASGRLVMGRGIAQQMRDRFKGSDVELAKIVRAFPAQHVGSLYYEPMFGKQRVGYFMVKQHWGAPASIPVILRSVAELIERAPEAGRVDLNFPGIGNGGLAREQVFPLLTPLPSNVHIWEYE